MHSIVTTMLTDRKIRYLASVQILNVIFFLYFLLPRLYSILHLIVIVLCHVRSSFEKVTAIKKPCAITQQEKTLLVHAETIFVTKGTAIPLKKVFYSFHIENPNIYAILATNLNQIIHAYPCTGFQIQMNLDFLLSICSKCIK